MTFTLFLLKKWTKHEGVAEFLAICLRIFSEMSLIASDWASPKSGTSFTGYTGNPLREGPGGPSGTLALCVANTPIPCKVEGMASQKSIQFTVINIRKKGWSYAPW